MVQYYILPYYYSLKILTGGEEKLIPTLTKPILIFKG